MLDRTVAFKLPHFPSGWFEPCSVTESDVQVEQRQNVSHRIFKISYVFRLPDHIKVSFGRLCMRKNSESETP